MRRALAHAQCGLGRTSPNPVVGACIVTDEGVVVGDGAHERAGGPHAEVFALEQAGPLARGGTLYCTLEPCCHIGRTGPCADRIIAAGIRRVVAAMEDPYPLVQGRGFAILREHGVEVVVGVERERAVRLNQPYLTSLRAGRPFVILKAATSLDGRMAAIAGQRTVLTSPRAARHAHAQRAQVDAIGVGSATVLADDPLLTARHVFRERPLTRIVFDRALRTRPAARVFSTLASGPVIIMTSSSAATEHPDRARAMERAGATVVALEDASMAGSLKALGARGVQSLVLEGGPTVHQAAWDAGLVDYMQLYVAPVVLGNGPAIAPGPAAAITSLVEPAVRQLGPDVLIEGYVHGPH
jgi:diaminohydroxyphosphoribosylaminopyrimidine deaminase/5-amino-6-(5-phosphoribosylamino)uracil reductase